MGQMGSPKLNAAGAAKLDKTGWKVFICYETHTGLDLARHLKVALESKAGMATFVADADIAAGPAWRPIIDKAITGCAFFIALGTILAPDSEEVKREIQLAERETRAIFPCRHEDVRRDAFLGLFQGEQRQEIAFQTKEELTRRVLKELTRGGERFTSRYVFALPSDQLPRLAHSEDRFLMEQQQQLLDHKNAPAVIANLTGWLKRKTEVQEEASRLLSGAYLIRGTDLYQRHEYAKAKDLFLLGAKHAENARERALEATAVAGAAASWGLLGYYDNAIELFDRVLLLRTGTPADFYNRGTAYGMNGLLDLAIADFDRAIALNPQYPPAYLHRGYAYYLKRSYDRALENLDRAVQLLPSDSEAHYTRSKAHMGKAQHREAIGDLDRALALDPDRVSIYNDRGSAYAMSGDYVNALADFNKAIALDANDYMAYSNRANVLSRDRRYQEALGDQNQALELNPTYWPALIGRAALYLQSGLLDEAIADCNRALDLRPSAGAYFNRGNAYIGKRQYDLAVNDFDSALALDP